MANKITIYTDGSCRNITHDRGGYGVVVINGTVKQFAGGSYFNTTSARMEIMAIIKGLQKVETGDHVTVYSDNQYAVNAVREKWVFRWMDSHPHNTKHKNMDLWKLFLKEFGRLKGNVELVWVKGHKGNHWNEVADILANMGAERKKRIKDTVI